MGTPTRDDVWLCIHLYEQRREPALREAREWMAGFVPRSFKEVAAVIDGKKGADANRYWRQATSYWEMTAALLLSGGVSPECVELFAQTTREWFLVWSKIAPFIDDLRAHYRPTAFRNLEALCRSLPDYDDAMVYFNRMNDRTLAASKSSIRGKAARKATKKAAKKSKAPALRRKKRA